MLPLLCKEMRQICSEREYYVLYLSSVAKEPRSVYSLSDTQLRRYFLDLVNLQDAAYGGADYYCCPVSAQKISKRVRNLKLLENGLDKIIAPQLIPPGHFCRYYMNVGEILHFMFDFKISCDNGGVVLLDFLVRYGRTFTVGMQRETGLLSFCYGDRMLKTAVLNENKWHRVSLCFSDLTPDGLTYRTLTFQIDQQPPENVDYFISRIQHSYLLYLVRHNFYAWTTPTSKEVVFSFGSILNRQDFEIKNISVLKKPIPTRKKYVLENYNISSGTLFDVQKHWEQIPRNHKKLWPSQLTCSDIYTPTSSSNHVVSVDPVPIYVAPIISREDSPTNAPKSILSGMVVQISSENFSKYGISHK